MADGSAIEWTEATWNPTTGCDRVSVGCDNCYALTMSRRLKAMGAAKYQLDGDPRTQLLEQMSSSVGSREGQAAVLGGARAFADIAGWNLETLNSLDRTGQLVIPGRFLTGNEVSDYPTLVEAKLKGRVAPVSKDRFTPLREAYQAAATISLRPEGHERPSAPSASRTTPSR